MVNFGINQRPSVELILFVFCGQSHLTYSQKLVLRILQDYPPILGRDVCVVLLLALQL